MLRCTGPRMWALLFGLLLSGVAFSAWAVDDPAELDRVVTALNRDAASDPEMARGIRDKLGTTGVFLLTSPTGANVPPGEALVLRALCPSCTGWTSGVPGTSVMLQDLLAMHEQQHMGWGKLSQDVLGLKLGPLVKQVADVHQGLSADASRRLGPASRVIEEGRAIGAGRGDGMGHRGQSGGGRGR